MAQPNVDLGVEAGLASRNNQLAWVDSQTRYLLLVSLVKLLLKGISGAHNDTHSRDKGYILPLAFCTMRKLVVQTSDLFNPF